ncbi:MAG: PEP-CTERM sorting domain-containing protein [Lentisphaeria bacterium]
MNVTMTLGVGLLLAGLTARADIIADWQFTEGNFLADSSPSGGHTLMKIGTVGDTGGVATFSAAGLLATTTNLDLTGYNKIRISWTWLVQNDNLGFLVDHGWNNAGGILLDANEAGAGLGRAGIRPSDLGWVVDEYVHAHGAENTTWENFAVEFDLTAATANEAVQVFKNGSPTGYPVSFGSIPSVFANSLLQIGGSTNNGTTYNGLGMVGQLDRLTIESIPEPGMIALLATSGLFYCARRKRK